MNEANDPVIEVTHLSKRFGDVTAVDDLSFSVNRGEILGLLGPNGAGKTTCVKMLCGLLAPDGGTIRIDGRPLGTGQSALSHVIGLSPQEIVVWSAMTCLEQLTFMGTMYGLTGRKSAARGESLLASFGLSEKRHRLARTLSGGMQRRLNIALALIHDPEILILDEPQAGLDPQSRVLVRDYVQGLKGRITVIITTHDMEEAEKLSDRVCIVDRGKLLVLDTVDRVKSDAGGVDNFRFEVAGLSAPQLKTLLEEDLPGRATWSIQGDAVLFSTMAGSGLLTDILRLIADRALRPTRLDMRQATLEDVFIGLTGRGLRE